jgi:hypothetical protein
MVASRKCCATIKDGSSGARSEFRFPEPRPSLKLKSS